MTLILASNRPELHHRDAIEQAVGKPLSSSRALWTANAADPTPGFEDLIALSRSSLTDMGLSVTDLDLRLYLSAQQEQELTRTIRSADLLWINGGNVYYLRWLLRATGADRIISTAVADGMVYGGGSAGAVVAGPTLEHFQPMDDPALAPEQVLEGLALTELVAIPHLDNPEMGAAAHYAVDHLTQDGYHTIALNDTQIAIVNDRGYQVL